MCFLPPLVVLALAVGSTGNMLPSTPFDILLERQRPLSVVPPSPTVLSFAPGFVSACGGDELSGVEVILENAWNGSMLYSSGTVMTRTPSILFNASAKLPPGVSVRARVRTSFGKSMCWSDWGMSGEWVVGIDADDVQSVGIWPGGSSVGFVRRDFDVRRALDGSALLRAWLFVTGEPGKTHGPAQLIGGAKAYLDGSWVSIGPGRGDPGWWVEGGNGSDGSSWVHPVDWVNATEMVMNAVEGSENLTLALSGFGGILWAEMWLVRADGDVVVMGTDTSGLWMGLDGSLAYPVGSHTASPFGSPQVNSDARFYPAGFSTHPYSTSEYNNAVHAVNPSAPTWAPITSVASSSFPHPLQSKRTRGIVITESVSPMMPLTPIPGATNAYFTQLEREFMGGWVIQVEDVPCRMKEVAVVVKLSEELTAPMTLAVPMRTGNNYTYTAVLGPPPNASCSGSWSSQVELWEYAEFRYVSLHLPPSTTPSSLSLSLTFYSLQYPWTESDFSFSSSSATLNQVVDLCKYTLEATSLDTYTDSNTREATVYEADGFINAGTKAWMQRETSWLLHSALFNYVYPTWPTEWLQFDILTATTDYTQSRSPELASRFLWLLANNTMRGYLQQDLVDWKNEPSRPFRDIVDWPQDSRDGYVFTDVNTVVNSFAYAALSSLSQLPPASSIASTLESQASALRTAMLKNLVNSSGIFCDGLCSNTTHTAIHASAFPLWHGVVEPGSGVDETAASFVKEVSLGAMSVYGAVAYLGSLRAVPWTTAAGYGQTALETIIASGLDAPNNHSWLAMAQTFNSTMTMEAWKPSEKPNLTFSHPWATGPLLHIIQGLLGITSSTNGSLIIAPQPGDGSIVRSANGTVATAWGVLSLSLTRSNQSTSLQLQLPSGSMPQVCLPLDSSTSCTVQVDGKEVCGLVDKTRSRVCVWVTRKSASNPTIIQRSV